MFLAKPFPGDEIKEAERRQGVWHIRGRTEIPAGFWWENLQSRRHMQNLGTDQSTVHQRIVKDHEQKCGINSFGSG
jgi:hypothetical protein